MTEEKIQELLSTLKGLTYNTKVLGEASCFSVISREGADKVENVIRQFLLDNHDSEYGELQAKVYTYEKIIANSNFAPMIIKDEQYRENDADYKDGLDDGRMEAWECVRKIFHMSQRDIEKMVGGTDFGDLNIIYEMSAPEAIKMIREYEKSKEAKE